MKLISVGACLQMGGTLASHMHLNTDPRLAGGERIKKYEEIRIKLHKVGISLWCAVFFQEVHVTRCVLWRRDCVSNGWCD